ARAVWSHPPPGAAGAMIFRSDWAKADVAMTHASAAPASAGMILNDIVSSSTSFCESRFWSGSVAGRSGGVPGTSRGTVHAYRMGGKQQSRLSSRPSAPDQVLGRPQAREPGRYVRQGRDELTGKSAGISSELPIEREHQGLVGDSLVGVQGPAAGGREGPERV